jgi:succinate dehydrogenase / fumarate reductase cytochrome b subunit
MGGTGAVAFAMHRLSGAVIALYGVSHVLVMATALRGGDGFNRLMNTFQQPWVLALEMLLIAVVLFHMLNGLRIVLFDLGIGIRHQKGLFWGLMAVGAVVLALTVAVTLPYIQGRELS